MTSSTIRPRGTGSALAVLLSLLVGAGALAAQGPAFPVLPAGAPAGSGVAERCDVRAPGTARCGVYRVWEDRAATSGRTLDIHFLILDATDPDARTDDPVLFFFGGPGVPTITQAPGIARGFRDLRRSRDLMLVELRGIGRSGGLTCDVPYPGGFESRFGALFDHDHLAACRDSLSERASLELYTTPISVDDVEELRRELGYEAVNLFGGSYGSRVAQVYMRRYPEAVRTVVMSGVTPVSEPGYVRTSPNLQTALELVIRECAEQGECAAAYPDLDRQMERAFARFADGPVPVELGGRTAPFHAADLGYALRGLLYTRSGEIPYRIAQAARGELTELAEYYVQRTDWVSGDDTATGNHLSVLCAEDIGPVSDEDVRRAAEGTFLRGHVILSYRAACGVWPEADLPHDFFDPIRSDIPTLLVSGERDPVTPPAAADRLARGLTDHLHVVIPDGGHGVVTDCVIAMITRFGEDGSLERVDPSCVSEAPPTEFRLP